MILFLEEVQPEAFRFLRVALLPAANASIYGQDVGPTPLSFNEQEQCSDNGTDKYALTILL
jgi:hypothetical protein